jgi:hypothetical protein
MISKYATETTDIQYNVSDVKNVNMLKKFLCLSFLKKPATLVTTKQN